MKTTLKHIVSAALTFALFGCILSGCKTTTTDTVTATTNERAMPKLTPWFLLED